MKEFILRILSIYTSSGTSERNRTESMSYSSELPVHAILCAYHMFSRLSDTSAVYSSGDMPAAILSSFSSYRLIISLVRLSVILISARQLSSSCLSESIVSFSLAFSSWSFALLAADFRPALIPVFLSCPDASGNVPAMHVPAASAAANAAAINLLIFIFILLIRGSWVRLMSESYADPQT